MSVESARIVVQARLLGEDTPARIFDAWKQYELEVQAAQPCYAVWSVTEEDDLPFLLPTDDCVHLRKEEGYEDIMLCPSCSARQALKVAVA